MCFVSWCSVFMCDARRTHVSSRIYQRVVLLSSSCRADAVVESNHVCDAGAQPWVTASDPVRESYREDGKVRTRTLANLSRWPEHKVDKLQRALKGLPAVRGL